MTLPAPGSRVGPVAGRQSRRDIPVYPITWRHHHNRRCSKWFNRTEKEDPSFLEVGSASLDSSRSWRSGFGERIKGISDVVGAERPSIMSGGVVGTPVHDTS